MRQLKMVEIEVPDDVVAATDYSRCGECRRPMFFDEAGDDYTGVERWRHWNPAIDQDHCAIDAPPPVIACSEPGRIVATISRPDDSDLLVRRAKTALAS